MGEFLAELLIDILTEGIFRLPGLLWRRVRAFCAYVFNSLRIKQRNNRGSLQALFDKAKAR
ncbi:MAG: hypothetical protein EAZ89_07930 [Bacteroidetes bacterium]|nr:MAG: hypothetical protein EAZ89_07930 [Bacteroidota bacterium]